MEYSLPYIIFILLFLGISVFQISLNIEEKSRSIINNTILLCYILFFGLRGLIGWDWTNYYPFFKGLNSITTFTYEPGFSYYMYFMKKICNNYQVFIFINTIIDAALIHVFLKRYLSEKYYAFGFAIFIAVCGFVLETDLLRNMKSILILMISLKYIEQNRIIVFYFLNVIAILFHWTALFYIPLYFLFKKRIPLIVFLIVIVVGNIIVILNIQYIKPILLYVSDILGGDAEDKIQFYVNSKKFSKSYDLSFGYFIRLFTSILVLFYYERILNYSKSAVIFVNAFFIWIVIYLFFSELSIVISRFGFVFGFSLSILIPILYEIIIPVSTKAALYLLYSLLIVARIYSSTNNILYRYDNVLLNNIIPYEQRLDVFNSNREKLEK